MIIGNFSSSVTSGNRIAIPKKIREYSGRQFIVTKWYETCLVLIAKDGFDALLNKLRRSDTRLTSALRDTERFVMGSSFEVTIDSQGRFVLPDALISFAKIQKEVIFLGLGDRVEIWDKAEWGKREQYISHNAATLLEEISHEK